MSGEWIKMRGALIDHPKVIAMGRSLMANSKFRDWLTPGGSGASNGQIVSTHALRCVTTALLMRCWSVAREHGKFVGNDLVLQHSTIYDIDDMAGAPGVGEAMQAVGWVCEENGITLPNFTEFNVPMTNAEKQAEYRARQKTLPKALQQNENELPLGSNAEPHNVTTREEKRREEQEHARVPSRFEEFWNAYPCRKGRVGAEKQWKAKGYDSIADRILADVAARKAGDRQWLEGFIPHGSTYVNGRGWEDAIEAPRTPRMQQRSSGATDLDYLNLVGK